VCLRLETLEARDCPSYFTPAQIQHAYGLDQAALDDGSGTYQIAADGAGQTIAIVDAYDAPNIATDLNTFSNRYGLPPANFTKVRVGNPTVNTGWAQEESLDVEWAHAMAPAANIVLFEGTNSSLSSLLSAVDQARRYAGVSVISMSWGSNEFSGETSYQNYFTTPAGHQGVTFVASSGDAGNTQATPEFPSISPNVVAVGGTSLFLSGGDYNYETGWNGSGGGQSSYFGVPDWQAGFTGLSRRSSPDVSFVADPNTGVLVVYNGGTYVFGGTSVSAPMFAGVMALVNEQRAILGYNSFDGPSETLPNLYSLTAGFDFTTISSGVNRTGSLITTVGQGSPITYNFINDLAYFGIYYSPPPGGSPGAGRGPTSEPATPPSNPPEVRHHLIDLQSLTLDQQPAGAAANVSVSPLSESLSLVVSATANRATAPSLEAPARPPEVTVPSPVASRDLLTVAPAVRVDVRFATASGLSGSNVEASPVAEPALPELLPPPLPTVSPVPQAPAGVLSPEALSVFAALPAVELDAPTGALAATDMVSEVIGRVNDSSGLAPVAVASAPVLLLFLANASERRRRALEAR
jgi:hypothetical protein